MKSMKIKISLIFLSYLILIMLIVISYVSIIPNENIVILENKSPSIIVEKNDVVDQENSVYEILEKDTKSKTLEDLIDLELSKNQSEIKFQKGDLKKDQYKIQFASFKEKKKSINVSKKLEEEVLKNTKLSLTIKKKILDDKSVYYRIITENKLNFKDAENICKKVLKQKYQCLIIKDNK